MGVAVTPMGEGMITLSRTKDNGDQRSITSGHSEIGSLSARIAGREC